MEVGQSQIVFKFLVISDLEPMVCTLGIDPDLNTPSELDAAAHEWHTAFEDNIVPLLSAAVTYKGTIAQHRFITGISEVDVTVSTDGAQSISACPQNTTWLVRKNTAATGRGKRGRMYLPGVPEGQVSAAGSIDGGTITAWNAALAAMKGDVSVATAVVNHGPTTGSGTDDVTTFTLEPKVATQRRRLRP